MKDWTIDQYLNYILMICELCELDVEEGENYRCNEYFSYVYHKGGDTKDLSLRCQNYYVETIGSEGEPLRCYLFEGKKVEEIPQDRFHALFHSFVTGMYSMNDLYPVDPREDVKQTLKGLKIQGDF